MSRIENVAVGDYIVVVDEAYRPEAFHPSAFKYTYIPEIKRKYPEPLLVVAIAAPFLLCEVVGEKSHAISVDSRHEDWTKIDQQYVREFCRLQERKIPDGIKSAEQKAKDLEDKKRICPVCAQRMGERRWRGKTGGTWVLSCARCNLQLVPIEDCNGPISAETSVKLARRQKNPQILRTAQILWYYRIR